MIPFLMRFLYVSGLMLLVIFISCTVKQKVVRQKDQSLLYRPGNNAIHPEFLVFHLSDTVSQLLVKLNTDELLFNQANPMNIMQAVVKISYQLIDITNDPNNDRLSDSSSVFRTIDKVAGRKISITTILVKAQFGKIYLLKVTTNDVLHNINQQNFVFVNKQTKHSAQNFKPISRQNDAPLFKTYISPNETVKILTNQQNVKKLFIRFQKDNTTLPPPPFSVQVEPKFVFKTDSIWSYDYNPQTSYLFSYQGLYLIQTDTAQSEGLFLANFGQIFPKINDASSMISPLEYLTTTEEFRNIQKTDNKKLAVDNYWLSITNKIDLARELIRIYYNRLSYANLYFTSYKEGWKTDRGMIYMIFGPPNFIGKTAFAETWEYHNKQRVSIFSIKFNKTSSPYSESHFIMQRDDSYTPFWRNAVESWHNGKVYSVDEQTQ